MNDLKVILQAVLDASSIGKSDISAIQKVLNKYHLNLAADLNKAELVKNVKQVIPDLEAELKKITGLDIKIHDTDILKAISQIEKETARAALEQERLAQSMAKVHEKSELLRKSEDKRRELDQAKAVNQSLEREYAFSQRTKNQASKIQDNLDMGSYSTKLIEVNNQLSKYRGLNGEVFSKARASVHALNIAYEKLKSTSRDDAKIEAEKEYQKCLSKTKNLLTQVKGDKNAEIISRNSAARVHFINDMNNYLSKNTAITKENRQMIQNWITTLDSMDDMTRGSFENMKSNFNTLDAAMSKSGSLGLSWSDKLKQTWSKYGGPSFVTGALMGVGAKAKQAITELKEIDSILTEISKTSDNLSKNDLAHLGNGAFEAASRYGRKASDYLIALQEMSKAGYENREGMSELSLLAQTAGDMTSDLANDYLIASDAAFGYAGDVEKLNALLDGQNQVTRKNAVRMEELANATKVAGNLLANTSNLEENQITALLATGIATSGENGEAVARAVKSIVMNLQQVKGEGGFDGEIIDEEQLAKVEARCHSVGIELEYMKDGITTLRNPIEVLKELADVYHSLPVGSDERAGILSDIGGKDTAKILSGILGNWDKYEKMLGDYANASGSAMNEAMKSADSWEGSLNRLSNTWSDTVGNIIDSEELTASINALNKFLEVINNITSTLGGLGTAGLIGGGALFIKNLDWLNHRATLNLA